MTKESKLIFTTDPAAELDRIVKDYNPPSVFIIADSHTAPAVARPLMQQSGRLNDARLITISPGDHNKSLDQLAEVWQSLSAGGATRRSLIINIGGGVVTDLGGFAAATFKRGVRFVNVPTTLLAAVDAAVGGKTGINFAGLKNEVGAFAPADAVIVWAGSFATLPHMELCSGYAELLKHSLLESPASLRRALCFDLAEPDFDRLQELLEESVRVKERIVAADPFEKGLRKALNLGHTVAHAVESLAMERGNEIPHGIAVAFGLVTDLVLSNMQEGFDASTLNSVAAYVRTYFPLPAISCGDYDRLISLMSHDKKNASPDRINFTLLSAPGQPLIDREADPDQIRNALDIARDLLRI